MDSSPAPATSQPTVHARPDAPVNSRARGGFWLVWFGAWVLRALVMTLRIRVEVPPLLQNRTGPEPFIFVFWHNRLLLIPSIWGRYIHSRGRPRGMALTSTSRDGEWVALFLERFGIGAVRGSGTRRGAASVRELAGWLRRGHDIGITPDGSRGPCYEVKPGLVLLAQLSGRAILPLSFEFSSAWRLKSWDKFFIPKPFSRVRFIAGEPYYVPRTKTPEEFEHERLRCEQLMRAQVEWK